MCGRSVVALLVVVLVVVLAILPSGEADHQEAHAYSRTKRAADAARKNLRVVSILETPYTMKSRNQEGSYHGYEGFIPDILKALEERIGFNFTFYIVPDGRYGARNKDGTWTGMIGEIIKKQNGDKTGADLAAAALTVTSLRQAHVDFIQPFHNLGLIMIMKKPKSVPNTRGIKDVVTPFKGGVWLALTISVLVVAALLSLNNRFNPYEQGSSPDSASRFNVAGSLWFAFSTLQWQGYDTTPRSIAAKVLSISWFGFVTLTLLTYTGSLVNQLSWVSSSPSEIKAETPQDLQDVVYNSRYNYGVVYGGSSMHYFMNADGPVYTRMKNYWSSPRGHLSFVNSTAEGIKRVKSGNYVFIAESPTAEYAAARDCSLMTVGPFLAPRSYAMAVSHTMDKPVSNSLHIAIMQMVEEGEIKALHDKWWYERTNICNAGPHDPRSRNRDQSSQGKSWRHLGEPQPVSLSMFSPALILLTVGVVLSLLLAGAEVVYFKHKGKEAGNQPGGGGKLMDDDTEMPDI